MLERNWLEVTMSRNLIRKMWPRLLRLRDRGIFGLGAFFIAAAGSISAAVTGPLEVKMLLAFVGGAGLAFAGGWSAYQFKRRRETKSRPPVLIGWGASVADAGIQLEEDPEASLGAAPLKARLHRLAMGAADRVYFPTSANLAAEPPPRMKSSGRTFSITRFVPNTILDPVINTPDVAPAVGEVLDACLVARANGYTTQVQVSSAGNSGSRIAAVTASKIGQDDKLGVLILSGHEAQQRSPASHWRKLGKEIIPSFSLVILSPFGFGMHRAGTDQLPDVLTLMRLPGECIFGDLERFMATEAGVYVTSPMVQLPRGHSQATVGRMARTNLEFCGQTLALNDPGFRTVGLWVGDRAELIALEETLSANPVTRHIAFVAKEAALPGIVGFVLREVVADHLVNTFFENFPVSQLQAYYRPVDPDDSAEDADAGDSEPAAVAPSWPGSRTQ